MLSTLILYLRMCRAPYAESHTQRVTKGGRNNPERDPVDLAQAERVDEIGWDGRERPSALSPNLDNKTRLFLPS